MHIHIDCRLYVCAYTQIYKYEYEYVYTQRGYM